MKAGQVTRWVFGAIILIAALGLTLDKAEAQTTQQPEAGKIAALIPTGSVLREKKNLEALKDMSVLWLDTIKTGKAGRARIRLGDGSVLNVGSQASMLIAKHDPGKQQTELDLIYGKVRADVTKISTPDGHFEIRTKVAVCGVVGTQEYLESNELATTAIALGGGQVRVTSTDPRFPGEVLLNPGEAVSVVADHGLGTKRQASANELLQALQDTEGETGATMEPAVSVAGRSFDATINGKNLSSVRSLSANQQGIAIRMRGEASATQIPLTITVDAGVPVGTYPITIDRPDGPIVAGFAVTGAAAITLAASGQGIQLPPAQDYTVTRGAKIPLDASGARAPAGTQIVAYHWSVPNTLQLGSGSTFTLNTSLLDPGNYTVQLMVMSDQGQVATQQSSIVVQPGVQPVEIVRDLGSAYESLQPSAFLKNFDEDRFRNYAGFAAAVEDSFRSKLETMRVFQRPVNCAVMEQQDEGVCQAEFQLQFTLKNQPSELLDSQGNPVPPGTAPSSTTTLGKRILKGSEQDTIRFERSDKGWRITDYSAVVSCPGGDSTSGINVGSCIFALGSPTTPSFQIANLQLFGTDLSVGGTVNGSFTVVPAGGFNGSINFTAQGQVGNQAVTAQFSPNPAGPNSTVNFTVFGPTAPPSGGGGPLPFTLVITGKDSTGLTTTSANAALTLQPDFNVVLSPATTSSSPQALTQNSTLPLTVQIASSSPFAGTVLIDFPNLPAGFSANAGNVAVGSQATFPISVSAAAAPGPALITVRGTLGSGAVKTATLFLNVTSNFSLSVTPPSSPANPIQGSNLAPIQLNVQVVPTFNFAGTVAIDFPNLPDNLTAQGGTVAAGATGNFTIQTSKIASAPPTVFTLTVRGTFANDVQTILVFVQLAFATPIVHGPQSAKVASAYATEPSRLKAGEALTATIYGKNLDSVTSVEVSGTGIKAELLEALASELHVRFTVDGSLSSGSRMIALRSNGNKVATLAIDVAAGPEFKKLPNVTKQESALATAGAASEKVQSSAFSGKKSEAATSGDSQPSPTNTKQLAQPGERFGLRQRGEVQVVLNGCTGFRLSSGSEQSCGGLADLEISSRGGASLVIEAEGVRSLGAGSWDQTENLGTDGMSESAALLPGNSYLVKTRRGLAVVRVLRARGLESMRNAPPAALRSPRVGGSGRGPVESSSQPSVTLFLEWKTLQR